MKKSFLFCLMLTLAALLLTACGQTTGLQVNAPRVPQAISETAPVIIPDTSNVKISDAPVLMWSEATHSSMTLDAARYWGLATARANNLSQAAAMPDTYQSGLSNGYNQQWSHAYLYTSLGVWIWGDADDDYFENLNQSDGEIESPEGYNGLSAKYYYGLGNQKTGDWYVGYATHYIEDTCLLLHASDPSVDMLTDHFKFEDWIKNNWTSGHNFYATIVADPYYYTVTNPKESIRSAAYYSGYWTSDLGKAVWDNYSACGYPTAAGTGNATLVAKAKEMVIRAARYSRGTIKYAFDTYSQWTFKGYVYP